MNALTVIVGGLIGIGIRGGIAERFKSIIEHGLALCVLVIGISGAIKTNDMMGLVVSTVLGCVVGEAIGIDKGLNRLGDWAQSKFSKSGGSFSQGFVSATLLFCVGAMAVVGSLEAGLSGNGDTLMAKAALDGVAAAVFASTLGIGVIFSVIPLTIYQGGIAILAVWVAPFVSDALINEVSAVGSVMIIALAVNMLGVLNAGRIRVANMLPSMLIVLAYRPVIDFFSSLF